MIEEDTSPKQTDEELGLCVLTLRKTSVKPLLTTVEVSGADLTMEIDTGAAVSLVPESVLKQKFPSEKLQPSSLVLKTYSGKQIVVFL